MRSDGAFFPPQSNGVGGSSSARSIALAASRTTGKLGAAGAATRRGGVMRNKHLSSQSEAIRHRASSDMGYLDKTRQPNWISTDAPIRSQTTRTGSSSRHWYPSSGAPWWSRGEPSDTVCIGLVSAGECSALSQCLIFRDPPGWVRCRVITVSAFVVGSLDRPVGK